MSVAGAAIMGGASLISGVMGSRSAKKQLRAQREMHAQSINAQKEQIRRGEVAYDQQKRFTGEQIERLNSEHADLQQKIAQAQAEGNQLLVDRYTNEAAQIQTNLQNQMAAVDQMGSDVQGAIDSARQSELAALQPSLMENERLRQQGLQSMDLARGELSSEMSRVAGQTKPEGLDYAQSEIDRQFENQAAELDRQNAARGRETGSGVSLALALQKARAKGQLSGDMRQGFAQQRTNYLAMLGGALQNNALGMMGLRDQRGEILANVARTYGAQNTALQQMLGQTNVGLEGQAAAQRLNSVSNRDTAKVDMFNQTVNRNLAATTDRNNTQRGLEGQLANFQLSTMGMQQNATNQITNTLGQAAAAAGDRANALSASASDAFGNLIGIAADVVKNQTGDNPTKLFWKK